jgi:hypothetical protein
MLLSMLHGLFTNRIPVFINDTYSTLSTNAFAAPVGKSYGSYTIDGNGVLALVRTTNLPDFVGSALKKVQLDFLLERFVTPQGDFVIATVQPFFPTDLGPQTISDHYVKSLKGRKFISYLKSGNWSAWKELNCTVKYLADFTSTDTVPMTVEIDPQTISEYFIKIGLGSTVTLTIPDKSKFVKPVHVDLVPSGSSYSVVWPSGLTWSNDGGTPPSTLEVGSRVRVKFELSFDNFLVASYSIYKVD